MEFREAILAIRPNADVELIGRAYDVAAQCHQGQKRRSGDPYITHPAAVATILAGLGIADDQMLCAAILHDTVEDTPYTRPSCDTTSVRRSRRWWADIRTLDRLRRIAPDYKVPQVMATIGSADTRVVAHEAGRPAAQHADCSVPATRETTAQGQGNHRYLPSRCPAARHVSGQSELQALACATLIRNRPAGPPRRRAIVGLDIEQSTSRPDPVKAELRIMLYELFEAALRSADIGPDRRGQFMDRGDGLLVLIDPAEEARLLSRVVPVFAQLLTGYNAGLPVAASAPGPCRRTRGRSPRRRQRVLRRGPGHRLPPARRPRGQGDAQGVAGSAPARDHPRDLPPARPSPCTSPAACTRAGSASPPCPD